MTILTPEYHTLLHVAQLLERLPLTSEQRAKVFQAWEGAPDAPIPAWPHPDADEQAFDRYSESPGGRAWRRVREIKLHRQGGSFYATTLEEAAHYESAPTKDEIVRALINAEHLLAGQKEQS